MQCYRKSLVPGQDANSMGNEQPFDQWTRFICIAFATHYRLGRQQAALINTDTRCAACRAVAQSMLDRRRSPFPFYSRVMVVFRPKFINCREEDRDRLVLSVTIHSSCIGICDTLAVVVEVNHHRLHHHVWPCELGHSNCMSLYSRFPVCGCCRVLLPRLMRRC